MQVKENTVQRVELFLSVNWQQVEYAIRGVCRDNGETYQAGLHSFQEGIKGQLDVFSSAEELAQYLTNKVYSNRRKSTFDDIMYWLVTFIYTVDRETTRASLKKQIERNLQNFYN